MLLVDRKMFVESTDMLSNKQTVLKVALGPIVDHVKDTRAIATPLASSVDDLREDFQSG